MAALAIAALLAFAPSATAVQAGATAPLLAEMRQAYSEAIALAELRGALSPDTAAVALQLASGSLSDAESDALLRQVQAELSEASAPSEEDRAVLEAGAQRFTTLALGLAAGLMASPSPLVEGSSPVDGDPYCARDCKLLYWHCVAICLQYFVPCMVAAMLAGPWWVVFCYAGYMACVLKCAIDYNRCLQKCGSREPPGARVAEVADLPPGPVQRAPGPLAPAVS